VRDTARIANVAPGNISLFPDAWSIPENGSVNLSGVFSDPGFDAQTVLIQWGDGSPDTTLNLPASAGSFIPFTAGPHTYLDKPLNQPFEFFLIHVAITDDHDIGTANTFVQVYDVAPTAHLSGPTSGVWGQSLTFDLSADDPSPLDRAASFTYTLH
jgi:hypothetical protein